MALYTQGDSNMSKTMCVVGPMVGRTWKGRNEVMVHCTSNGGNPVFSIHYKFIDVTVVRKATKIHSMMCGQGEFMMVRTDVRLENYGTMSLYGDGSCDV